MRQKHSKLNLCVTLIILLGWCVCPQLRAYDVEVDGIYYNLSGTSATVTYPTESAPSSTVANPYTGSIVIPSTIEVEGTTYTVTTIGVDAFFYATITSVEIPSTVTEIQKESFARTSLTTVTIPNSVVYLRNDAFAYNSKLKKAYVGSGVTTLNQGVFYGTRLTDIYFYGDTPPSSRGAYLLSYKPTLHCTPISLKKYQEAFASFTSTFVADVEKDYTYEDLQSILNNFSTASLDIGSIPLGISSNPGYYTPQTSEAFNTAIEEAQAIDSDAATETISNAVYQLGVAYNALSAIPVTEGYYVLLCDNGKIAANDKSTKAMYIDSEKNQVYWGEYEENNLKYIFKISANDEKWNIQSVENSLYVNGATAFCAVFDAADTPTSKTTFNFYYGTGSCYIKNVLDSQTNQSLWTLCPQGNAAGTSSGPSSVFAYNGEGTSGGNVPYAEWTWRLIPISEETVNNILSGLTTLLETKEILTPSDDPNRYSEAEVAEYNAVITQAQAALTNATLEEKKAACEALSKIDKSQLTPNPITEGYYYITTAGNGPGASGGPYNYEDKKAMYNTGGYVKWTTYKQSTKNQIYYFFEGKDGWYVYNFVNKTYIDKPVSTYACNVKTSTEATTTQKFISMEDGSGKYAMYSTTYMYAMTSSHNGSSSSTANLNVWGSASEARKYGVNQWFLHKVPETYSAQYDDALALIKFKNTIAEYEAALSTYKTSIQDGDYYASTDDNHGLKSHYFVDGTEKTSQKGYECTQAQIDALSEAISEAQALLNDTSSSLEAISAAVDKATAAKEVCDKQWDPVTNGVYFIINGFADDAPDAAQALKYGEDGDVLYKRPLVTADPRQMFEVEILSWDTDTDGDQIPTSAYIKNVASGKYLGGVSNGQNVFSDTPVAISWPESNTQGATKQAHRFQLQTPTGETFNGKSNTAGCEVTTSGGNQWNRSWMFRPADNYYQEYLNDPETSQLVDILMSASSSISSAITPADHHDNTGTRSFLLGNEKTSIDGLATSKEAVDELKAAYTVVDNAFKEGKKLSDLTTEVKTLTDAQAVVETKSNPLTSGFYQIIAEYGDDTNDIPGGFALQYGCDTDNPDAAYKSPYDADNLNQIFYVDYDKENGKVTLRNVNSGKYLGKLNDNGNWEFSAESTSLNITSGNPYYWYRSEDQTKAARSCSFIMTDDNANSMMSSTGEANQIGNVSGVNSGTSAWTVAWAFRPVDASIVPETTVADGIATINYDGEVTTQVYALAKAMIIDNSITSIDLTDVELGDLTPDDIVISSISKNAVYYLPDTYTQDASNFVTDGTCSQLVLTDKADFAPATPFTATNASYTKTGLDGKGWYTAVLPYAINVPEGMTAIGNAIVSDSEIKFEQINVGEVIEANTPFIYKTAADAVTFEASNAKITAEPLTSGMLKGTYTLIPAGEATGKLIINADGSAFATATERASIPAFRAYLDQVAGSGTFKIVINNDLTGVASGDALNGKTELVDVCTIDGKVVRKQIDSITALRGLPRGIYIVNGTKIKK